jgi:hypothetical protein
MSGRKKKRSGRLALFVILITVGLLMFFGILTVKADDFNDFLNLIRDWVTEMTTGTK